jgi:hypothetical protein
MGIHSKLNALDARIDALTEASDGERRTMRRNGMKMNFKGTGYGRRLRRGVVLAFGCWLLFGASFIEAQQPSTWPTSGALS